MTTSPRARRPAGVLATLLAAFAVTLGTPAGLATPAHAADIYRYWTYFHVEDGEYVASMKGVGEFVPKDGSIEAFRYAAPRDYQNPNLPRADLSEVTLDAVCGAEEAGSGEKRVAVVVDYGVKADAEGAEVPTPEAACAVVPRRATALQTLDAVLQTRTDSGLLCAIEGYPASGCAEVVKKATPADAGPVAFTVAGAESADAEQGTSETESDAAAGTDAGSTSDVVLLAAVGAAALALLGGGVMLARRRAG